MTWMIYHVTLHYTTYWHSLSTTVRIFSHHERVFKGARESYWNGISILYEIRLIFPVLIFSYFSYMIDSIPFVIPINLTSHTHTHRFLIILYAILLFYSGDERICTHKARIAYMFCINVIFDIIETRAMITQPQCNKLKHVFPLKIIILEDTFLVVAIY